MSATRNSVVVAHRLARAMQSSPRAGTGAICARCSVRRATPGLARGISTVRSKTTISGPLQFRPARFLSTQRRARRRGSATPSSKGTHGPIQEYDERVKTNRLKNDKFQRGMVQHLQNLHEALLDYQAPTVVHPSLESLKPPPRQSLFGSLFGGSKKVEEKKTQVPENVPQGVYMFGDVGCGKTMLMDLFYDTLPEHVTSKTRIHFHNFMQDVHRRLHKEKMLHGNDFDAVPFIAADIAESASVLCFDEFQCTDVADAMILRRLLESLMSHGVVLVTTSNRHPTELYKNGIQRESFLPCIDLLQKNLTVLNLDSKTDYRKIPRPASGVYHTPLDSAASAHADKWFAYLGDFENDPPHPATHTVWGREITVPKASGKAAMFEFDELIGKATGAADYIELVARYDAFIVKNVPSMSHRQRDLARRFITFIDAVYEGRAKLVLTTESSLAELFLAKDKLDKALNSKSPKKSPADEGADLDASMRNLMDDLGLSMSALKNTSIFSGDEEKFAFARALSRLTEMGSKEWVERGVEGK